MICLDFGALDESPGEMMNYDSLKMIINPTMSDYLQTGQIKI